MKNFKKLLREHRKAFTLAEVVIVMAILSIMMVAFAPVLTKKANTSTDSFRTFQRTASNHGVYYGTRRDTKPVVIGDNELRYNVGEGGYNPKLVIAATTTGNGNAAQFTPHIGFLADNAGNNTHKYATGQLLVIGGYVSSGDIDPAAPAPAVAVNTNYLRHLMPMAYAAIDQSKTFEDLQSEQLTPGGGGGGGGGTGGGGANGNYTNPVDLSRGITVVLGGNPIARYSLGSANDNMTIIGGNACPGATGGVQGLTCLGANTANEAVVGTNTTFIGRNAGENATIGNDSILIGRDAGSRQSELGINSILIGHNAGAGNTGEGNGSELGDNTIMIGNNAGNHATAGAGAIFIGNGAGQNSGSSDFDESAGAIYIGNGAGSGRNSYDNENAILIGNGAGNTNHVGYKTIGIGSNTHVAGLRSIVIGSDAYLSSQDSVVVGAEAEARNGNTVAVGYKAGQNYTGTGNVFIGRGAGGELETANASTYGIYIGYYAGGGSNSSIAIGNGAKATANNVVAIGNGAGVKEGHTQSANSIYLSGTNLSIGANNFWIGNSLAKVWICSVLGGSWIERDGGVFAIHPPHCEFPAYAINQSLTKLDDNIQLALLTGNESGIPSDERLKNVGKPFQEGLALIEKIMPVNFTYKRDENKIQHVGVVAQDLMKIIPNAVNSNKDGFLYIRTEDMFYAAINAIKELHQMFLDHDKRIKELEARNAVLEQQNKELMELYTDLAKRVERLDKKKAKDVKFTPMPVFEEETEEEVKTEK